MLTFRIVEDGDSAVVVEFDERIDATINAQVITASQAVLASRIAGIRDVVPTFRSLTVYFDPMVADRSLLRECLERAAGVATADQGRAIRILRIPVCYGGVYGPDLGDVAAFAGLGQADVIAIHSAPLYRVFMLGFVPGFAYLGPVDPRIAAPRLPTPRSRVEGGSVAVAGEQTGIYPFETPGGWRLIGRTPIMPFDMRRQDPFLFKPGDSVQFYPIQSGEFEHAHGAVRETM